MKNIPNKTQRMIEIESAYRLSIEEVLRVLYVEQNLSVKQICVILNLSYVTVLSWLSKANITSRKIQFEV